MSQWGAPGRSNPPAARFNELLEQLKMEYGSQHDRAENNEQQCKSMQSRHANSAPKGAVWQCVQSH